MDAIRKLWAIVKRASDSPLTGPAPLWWTGLVLAAGAYAEARWGIQLCP